MWEIFHFLLIYYCVIFCVSFSSTEKYFIAKLILGNVIFTMVAKRDFVKCDQLRREMQR